MTRASSIHARIISDRFASPRPLAISSSASQRSSSMRTFRSVVPRGMSGDLHALCGEAGAEDGRAEHLRVVVGHFSDLLRGAADVRVIDHEGDHRPAGFDGTIWCTWADEEAAS